MSGFTSEQDARTLRDALAVIDRLRESAGDSTWRLEPSQAYYRGEIVARLDAAARALTLAAIGIAIFEKDEYANAITDDAAWQRLTGEQVPA